MASKLLFVAKDLASKLSGRFNLRADETRVDNWQLSPVVVPVTNVDELVKVIHCAEKAMDISGTAGTAAAFFTVPEGKRWTLLGMIKEGTTGNSFPFVRDPATKTMFGFGGSDANYQRYYNLNWVLGSGWVIGQSQTGNGADNSHTNVILYYEEDAY